MRIIPLFEDQIFVYEFPPHARSIKYGRMVEIHIRKFVGKSFYLKFPYTQFTFLKTSETKYIFYVNTSSLPYGSEENEYFHIFNKSEICLGEWDDKSAKPIDYITRFWHTSFTESDIYIDFEKHDKYRTLPARNLAMLKTIWFNYHPHKISCYELTEDEEYTLALYYPLFVRYIKNPRPLSLERYRSFITKINLDFPGNTND